MSTIDLFEDDEEIQLDDAQTQILLPTKKRKFNDDEDEEEIVNVTKYSFELYSNENNGKKSFAIDGEWEEGGKFVISRKLFMNSLTLGKDKALRVSRSHAVILCQLGKSGEHQFWIVDESQGGILINGGEILKNRQVEIKSGDNISILFKRSGNKTETETEIGILFKCHSQSSKVPKKNNFKRKRLSGRRVHKKKKKEFQT